MLDDTRAGGVRPADCTLVIPAYNEERRIRSLLEDVSGFRGKLVFVCDGTDATAEIVGTFAEAHPSLSIRCLAFPARLGKGGGVVAGMAAAETPFVGYMDADGSTALSEMERLFDRLATADGAIGSRWVEGSVLPVRQGFRRRVESRLFNLMVKAFFGLGYRDTQCGAKVFRKDALREVLSSIRSTGFEFDVELLWRLRRSGYRVEEVPITWENRDESKVMTSDAKAMLLGMIRLRFG
ncbi:dolichyl-phosphate beta-glucosyltransferase [Methanoculleus horonobensis]|jgi:dolichol-phosphate mannosyltransferase|uniref:dolichyl-phosphate beta-glucosyltransferase n=1 Tax=Methanoculleus horonobensis TaxID=528314 RepID=UPI0008365B32|nr:dolichyl-phosphate beta-glucosyltransferase [Methanoculleus horonobensis]MDD3071355.1 glycosyltransferase family 2 protein [Methanoculleus horonobensis]MDD4252739.1 glycosyltransferase family 2 protein [Methanoculleus horonobensis]